MRDIKFRVYYRNSMQPLRDVLTFWNDGKLEVTTDNLMQYTGIKDKNGKEIYEGDIVKYLNRIGKIEWHEYQASFDLTYVKAIEGLPYIKIRPISNNQWRIDLEIIGNIHENPELL